MDAVVSGRAGIALLRSDDSITSISVANPKRLVPRSASAWNLLFGDARDIQVLENVSVDDAVRALDRAHKRTMALDLALIQLDPDLSEPQRRHAADALELLVREQACLEDLSFVLYARPVPRTADLEGARGNAASGSKVVLLLSELAAHQPAILRVATAWDMVRSSAQVEDQDDWDSLRRAAVECGLFYLLSVNASVSRVAEALTVAVQRSDTRPIPSARRVLTRWITSAAEKKDLPAATRSPAIVRLARPVFAVDFGTSTTQVYASGHGIILSEPSIAAFNRETLKIEAIGDEAVRLLDESPNHLKELRPGFQDAAEFAKAYPHFLRKASFGRSQSSGDLVIAVPGGISRVEARVVRGFVPDGMFSNVRIVNESVAAAVGSGLPIPPPDGRLLVDIGATTTEIAAISAAGIVYSKTIRIAGSQFDAAIVKDVARRHKVKIGVRSAEYIKRTFGLSSASADARAMQLKGRNLDTDAVVTFTITSEEVREALEQPVIEIISAIRLANGRLPPELESEVAENGILLTGGASLLPGLVERLTRDVGLAVKRAEDPASTVARGAGLILESPGLLQRVENLTGAAY